MIKKTIAASLLVLSCNTSLFGALVYNNDFSLIEGNFAAAINDLAQTNLSSIVRDSGGVTNIYGTEPEKLVDGSVASTSGLYHSSTDFPTTYTLEFDISTNTLGYDITGINTIAGWHQNGLTLANQQYQLLYSVVGDASFQSLGVQSHTPFTSTTATGSSASLLSITDDSGFLAQGVDAIRFIVQDHGIDAGQAHGTVFKEFDVLGVAAIPEPSSAALIGLGGFSLLMRRRRIY